MLDGTALTPPRLSLPWVIPPAATHKQTTPLFFAVCLLLKCGRLPLFSALLRLPSLPHSFPRTLLHLARRSDYLQALCVRCFQPSHSLRSCSSLVRCSASLCIACAVAVLFCLRTSVLSCPRLSLPALAFEGGANTEPRFCIIALRCLSEDMTFIGNEREKHRMILGLRF